MSFWKKIFGKKKPPHELLRAGDFKGALKGFLEELKNKTTTDPGLLMQIADLYVKTDNLEEAKKTYVKVGSYYGEKGFFNKSVAAFKKALNISPDDKEILDKLAGFNNKVPKYMVSDSFLQAASGEFPAFVDEDLQESLPQSPPEEQMAPLITEELDGGEPMQDASLAEALQDLEEEDDDVFSDVSLDDIGEGGSSLTDLAKEENPQPVSDAGAFHAPSENLDAGIDFDESESESGLSPETEAAADEPLEADEPEAETTAATAQSKFAVGLTEAEAAASGEYPAVEQEPVQAPETAELRQTRESENMVFTSQQGSYEKRKPGGRDQAFASFDDALDSLFATDPSPEEQQQNELHYRHWPLFRTMDGADFQDFVLALDSRDYESGHFIVQEGDDGREMYLIAYGSVNVFVDSNGEEMQIASLGEGDFFGEASLLTGKPRNASVIASEPTNCLILTRDHLKSLSKKNVEILKSIRNIYANRKKRHPKAAEAHKLS